VRTQGPQAVDIEHIDDEDEPVIEMNLGVGVSADDEADKGADDGAGLSAATIVIPGKPKDQPPAQGKAVLIEELSPKGKNSSRAP